MYKIARENLTALFQKIAADQELYLPVRTADQVNFGVWTEDADVDLDTLKSVKSPKDVFFPQSETLYTCIRDGKKLKVEPEALKEQDFVVFGMKACDLKAWRCWTGYFFRILWTASMRQEEITAPS